jgi:hypothetical protein
MMQAMLQAEHRVNHATQGEGESGECRGAASCIQSNMSVRPSVDPQAGSHRAPIRSKVTLTSSDMACWPLWQDLFRRQIMPLALSRIRSELAATCRHARMLRDAATQGSTDAAADSRAARSRDSQLPHTSNDQRAAMLGLRGRFASLCATRSPARIQAAVPARTFAADKPPHPEGITHRISTYFMPQVLLASRRPSSPPATVAGCIQRRT